MLAASVGFFLVGALVTVAPAAAAGPGVLTAPTLTYSDQDGSIRAIGLDGSNARVLLQGKDELSTATGYFVPTVSPDGTRLAVVEEVSDDTARTVTDRILILDLATGAMVGTTPAPNVWPYEPRWSADGTRLYYTRVTFSGSGVTTAVLRLPAAGGAPTTVMSNAVLDDISPAGTQLLVHVGATSEMGTLSVRDLESTSTAAVPGATGANAAAWSPDGTSLAMLNAAATQLFTVAARGGTPVKVPTVALNAAGDLDWTPDGDAVVLPLYENDGPGGSIERIDVSSGARTVLVQGTELEVGGLDVWGPTAARDSDSTIPAAVTGMSASRTTTGVLVRWTNPLDADWTRTVVRVDGKIVAAGRITSYATAFGRTTVTPYDGYGNAGPEAVLTVASLLAPVTAGLASAAPPFAVTWSAPSATGYTVRWTTQSLTSTGWKLQPWKTWLVDTSSTSATFGAGSLPVRAAPGQTYYVSVTPSVEGLTLATTAATVVPYDQTATSGSAGWVTLRGSGYYLGTAYSSRTPNAYRSMAVYASSIAVIGKTCPTCGVARIYLDGKLVKTVDTRSSTTKLRQQLWRSGTYSAIGRHVVKVVVVGTPGRPYVVIDAIAAKR